MPLTLDDLFSSPDHYLHSFEGDAAVFVPMDREAYRRSLFLDDRISPTADQVMRLPVQMLSAGTPKRMPTYWIFHVAHCGSTLLSRALDDAALNLVLREPLALRQLAIAPDPRRLAIVAAMLSKRYRANLPTLVKANVPVNFLLPQLVDLDPGAHAIFLHLRLKDYLFAILRDENHRRWLGRVTVQLGAYLGDLSALTDAERCAALWLAQMRAFIAAISRMPNARALDAETFFASPRQVLKAAAGHFGTPMSDAAIAAIVEGPLFATYSKNPSVPFDNAARVARRTELEERLNPEVEQALAWIETNGSETALIAAALDAARLPA
jgi:hypothetical protein